jgi:dinuclear metal center YbgI/SA1388 family protein
MLINELTHYLSTILNSADIPDYTPNGLQIAGVKNVQTLITGVTASQALIDVAIAKKADALLVHHGYFWKNEDPCLVGMKQKRIKALLDNEINLIAYHLPLDQHPVFGNNVQLAKLLNLQITHELQDRFGHYAGLAGKLSQPLSACDFAAIIEKKLHRPPLHIAANQDPIQRIALCTGSAAQYIDAAANDRQDAYLSGEISESTVHIARERNIHYFCAGHHATERYGIKALGEHLASKFGLHSEFVDIDNPA